MKINSDKIKHLSFLIIVVLLIVPQTRMPIQIMLHKGLALFSPSINKLAKQRVLKDYNWQLKTKDKLFNFSNTKGKVVLISFWATWCPPCIAELPGMQLLYNDYKNDIEFVFISNEALTTVNTFMSKNKYSFKVYQAMGSPPELFNVKSIPRTFLIDKNGSIIIDKTGAANWNSESVRTVIDKLLL